MHVAPDTRPSEFFEQLLPAEFARRAAAHPVAEGESLWVRVTVTGSEAEGAGSWDLRATGKTLAVTPARAGGGEPPLSVRQTVADWAALAVGPRPGTANGLRLAPAGSTPLDGLMLDAATRRLLAQVKGTLAFQVLGYEGRTWQLDLKLGDGSWPARADAVIAVEARDYGAIVAGQLNPAEAFFQQKIRLSGNTGLAMQLGMAILPRLAQKR
jgi:hypothetical protein